MLLVLITDSISLFFYMLNTSFFNLLIVIPAYNEAKSLQKEVFVSFLKTNREVSICFVNDGSTDTTLTLLQEIAAELPSQISVYNCKQNLGKAGATLAGMQYCEQNFNYIKIAYLDADLATSLEECVRLSEELKDEITFTFGSRMKRLDSVIERSTFRFFTGRIIATFISKILKLGVYDTQCGAKVFAKDLASKVFQQDFISKWLFDVEIFFRILTIYKRPVAIHKIKEVPLNKWVDQGDSKVKISYFFKLWLDLIKIKLAYKNI